MKLFHRLPLSVAFVTLALSATACGNNLRVAYQPSTAAAAPSTGAAVNVKVVDSRPEDHGGSEKAVVGQIRSGVGIPRAMKDSDPDAATRTVSEATSDALKRAGVGTGKGKTLVATVKEFWMDGYVGYKGTVIVDYSLQDEGGKALWSKTLTANGGTSGVAKGPDTVVQDVFKEALTNLATSATTEFQSAEFQAAAK